jgi:alpha-amylase
VWEAANVYFLLTDRFNNADPSNDVNFERTEETAVLRGFEGGDLKGITQKINEGYFTDLGINAIWMTPVVEQIHGAIQMKEPGKPTAIMVTGLKTGQQ